MNMVYYKMRYNFIGRHTMKKLIALLITAALGICVGYYGFSYVRMQAYAAQEKRADDFMQTKIPGLVKTWNQAEAPTLFADNVNIFSMIKVLQLIKDDFGSCELKSVQKCESLERYRTTRMDKYRSPAGFSIRCPFELSCEKAKKVMGEAVFQPDDKTTKLYGLSLNDE